MRAIRLVLQPEAGVLGHNCAAQCVDDILDTAQAGLVRIRELARRCSIPTGLSALRVPTAAIPGMARAAVQITRLMRNNPREMTAADAEAIYRAAYA